MAEPADIYESGEPEAGDAGADASAPRDAKRYLDMIAEAERYFATYQEKADNIDKLYADLEKMANASREREMQVFWANLEVLKPSIYSRPPVPVVVPRFKDRKPLPRTTAELIERSLTTSFSIEDIDAVMKQVRDDLAINARGVVWMRFEKTTDTSGQEYECVRYDHVERKDFLHEPARKWQEVGWVARRAWLNRREGLKRFGNKWLRASFKAMDDDGKEDKLSKEQKGEVWEIWDKSENITCWVTPGVEELLDESEPEVTLEGFFPCPRPAYGTLQRRTLKPVSDFLYYKDQLEEINELTARISALAEGLRLKGFYAAGAGELADVVEAALKAQSNNAILIPVSNFAALGGTALKDAIVWLPIVDVLNAIKGCIELRRQLIEDVYQVTGLSDIMRGATDPNETLGAQELKSQYGSIRIRDRQAELVRIARDITRIAAEIMAENFSPKTLLAMSQMEIPTKQGLVQQAQPLVAQKQQIVNKVQQTIQQVQQDPQMQQELQQNPDRAKQLLAAAQAQVQQIDAQVQKLMQQPTVETVMGFLRDQRMRPYVLDIETDSTIAPDENAQKKRATEFVTATGGFIAQVVPLVTEVPAIAPLAASFLKYVSSQFRAGRQLESDIDEFADKITDMPNQQKPPPPEVQAAQAKAAADAQKSKGDLAAQQQDAQIKQQTAAQASEAHQAELARQQAAAEHQTQIREREHALKMQGMTAEQQRAAETHMMAQAPQAPDQFAERKMAMEERSASLADQKLQGEIDALKEQMGATQGLPALVAAMTQTVMELERAVENFAKAAAAPKQIEIIRSNGEIKGGISQPVAMQ